MKESKPEDILIIGIGNSGRRDDGLGWAFLDRIRQTGYPGPTLYKYQLQIEEAEAISRYHRVIFVDASSEHPSKPFEWRQITPARTTSFTTHRMTPQAVMALCRDLYGFCPECYGLYITGAEWSLREGLSETAILHLEKALRYFTEQNIASAGWV